MQDAIVNLVHPVISYALELKAKLERGEAPAFEIEQAALKGLLLSEMEARRWGDFGGEGGAETMAASAHRGEDVRGRGAQQFLGIRYALVCWIDEVFILDSSWGEKWNEKKMEVALYGTNDRAWKFWEQARRAEARSGKDAVEVFFLCVMLGFRGELRERPDQLQAWVAATRAQMARNQAQEWPYPPELEPPSSVPPLHGRDRFGTMVMVVGVVLLMLIPLAAFLAVQQLG